MALTKVRGSGIDADGQEIILDADTDTTITADTDDQIDIKTGGSDRVTIDSSGNVGIGTTSPDAQGGNQNIIFNIEGSDNIAYLSGGSGGNAVDDGFAIEGVATGVTSNDKRLGQIGMFRTNTSTTSLNSQMAFYTTGSGTHSEAMRITDSGGLLISCTTEPSNTTSGIFLRDNSEGGCKFSRGNATSLTTMLEFLNGNGSVGTIKTTGTSTQFNTSSDYRLKENVVTDWDATTRLKQLKPSRFNFIADANTTLDGFIAHEVANVVPESISGDKDAVDADGNIDPQGIDQSKLVPLLTKALQEAVAKIETLEAKVTALENA